MLKVPIVVNHVRRKVLSIAATSLRTFSSKTGILAPGASVASVNGESTFEETSKFQYPEREISLLGPVDLRAPLPGNVGIAVNKSPTPAKIRESTSNNGIFTTELPQQRHVNVLNQFLNPLDGEQNITLSVAQELLECNARACPQLLKRDFSDLFPERDFMHENLTLFSISRRTKNDMSCWSEENEMERGELQEYFVSLAEEICNLLNEAGFWADFIDPTYGKPFFGPHTNASMYETDDRYRNFGFEIEDLGCCKIIRHHSWGTNAFVGSLFTNAPIDSPVTKLILQKYNLYLGN